MKRSIVLLACWGFPVFTLLASLAANGQTHFRFTSNTGNNATVAVPTSASPSIGGAGLAAGDEIGAFTPDGLCSGAVVWNGSNAVITVWGDNDQTAAIDGMRAGEQVSYRVWQQSTSTEYNSVNVTYLQGDGSYSANAIYALASFNAVVPPAVPQLLSPADAAANITTSPTLSWSAASRATSYRIQVSTSASFSTAVVDDSTLATTSRQVGPLTNNSTFFWRVNARNSGGTSAWSNVRSFTTVPVPPPAPALASPANNSAGLATTLSLHWNASTGASSYHLQLSTSSSFSAGALLVDSDLPGTSLQVGPLANGTKHYWRVNAGNAGGTSGYSSVWNFTTIGATITHRIVAGQGWNMVSSFVQPSSSNLDTICLSIRQNLVLMKNGAGQVYWPAFGINSIGSWNTHNGYQLYMQSADTMLMQGIAILPENSPIALIQGWNMVSYLRNSPMRVDSSLVSIAASIVLAKNNLGQIYWPAFGINTIGSMQPGAGYQLYVSQASTLSYPSDASASALPIAGGGDNTPGMTRAVVPKAHFAAASNTGNNASVAILADPGVDGAVPAPGDEIAAFTPAGLCAGAVVWTGTNTALTIWGDDDQTPGIDGMREGEQISYRIWRQSTGTELANVHGTYAQGDGLYRKDGIYSIASLNAGAADAGNLKKSPGTFRLDQNYPNPFNPSTGISYSVPKKQFISLKVYNVLGGEVTTLVGKEQEPGTYTVAFDASQLASGVYFYRLATGAFVSVKRMTIMR